MFFAIMYNGIKDKKILMLEPIIKTEHLRVIYNQGKSNEVRTLEDISMDIFPQEYVIIYGPSGCGKSTLLYSIAGLQMPTYGNVLIHKKSVAKMSGEEMVDLHRNKIGMIFQSFFLVPSLTVIDNVCLPRVFRGEGEKKRREEGFRLLHRFGIVEQAFKFPNQLSGGQKQRVAIARSLVNNPQIILADEPVGNLDSESAQNVLDILKELNGMDKKTVIMVTHNLEHLHYADRTISMRDGKVIEEKVNIEKRPENYIEEIKKRTWIGDEPIPEELRVLMRTFKGLSASQVGVLLIPFKSKQIMSHILSNLTEEQFNVAEGLVKEVLFRNIDLNALEKRLDVKFEKGGANWNKKKARSFVTRLNEIMEQAGILTKDPEKAVISIPEHIISRYKLKLSESMKLRMRSFIKLRLENKIDIMGLISKLDAPEGKEGLGLNKITAEKISREIEIIMLIKYSG